MEDAFDKSEGNSGICDEEIGDGKEWGGME
jgi:hypothetical protein